MFLKKYKEKIRDGGASDLIVALLTIPLLFILIISIVDGATYFNNKAQIQTWANNGARTTAIYGGAGTVNSQTVIEAAYGTSCNWDSSEYDSDYMKANPSNAVECNVLNEIGHSKNLTSVVIQSIHCGTFDGSDNLGTGPAEKIGDNVGCLIGWDYDSIPGSAFSIFQQVNKNTEIGGNILTLGLATSEVSLSPINDMVTRPNNGQDGICFATGIGTC